MQVGQLMVNILQKVLVLHFVVSSNEVLINILPRCTDSHQQECDTLAQLYKLCNKVIYVLFN